MRLLGFLADFWPRRSKAEARRYIKKELQHLRLKELSDLVPMLNHRKYWGMSVHEIYDFIKIPDYPVEVYLDNNGEFLEPLEVGIAFDYCCLARWYMPDCVPGVLSHILLEDKMGDRGYVFNSAEDGWCTELVRVICAEGKYILVNANKVLGEHDNNYAAIENHFNARGIDFVVDEIPETTESRTENGPTIKTQVRRGITSDRVWPITTKAVVKWDPAATSFSSVSISGIPAGQKTNSTGPVASGK